MSLCERTCGTSGGRRGVTEVVLSFHLPDKGSVEAVVMDAVVVEH